MSSRFFLVADHIIQLQHCETAIPPLELLPSFRGFETEPADDVLFSLTVDDALRPAKEKRLVRKFDTGNGDTIVYMLPDGGYQYIIRDISGNDCCLLIADRDFRNCRCALNGNWTMRSFGLNNAIMLVYAFAGAQCQTILVHASVAMLPHPADSCKYWAFPFTAASGTGKSTHTSLWLKHIEGAQLLNDDNPVVRIGDDGTPYIYGSPWSGKTPCYRQRRARLGAVTLIKRASQNSMERQAPLQAFATMLQACSSMKWDERLYGLLGDTITAIIENTPMFTLHCQPDREAAVLSHNTLTTEAWKRE